MPNYISAPLPDVVVAQTDQLEQQLADAHREIAHLQNALATSKVIGAALGILMARYNMTQDAAWKLLSDVSQRRGQKVRVIAERVVLEGTL